MTKAYYFEIGQGTDEWASYVAVKTKDLKRDVADEVEALMRGDFSGWTDDHAIVEWGSANLDIDFAGQVEADLIFSITNPTSTNATYFDKNDPLETVKIKGMARAKVIRDCATYPKNASSPVWASAKVDFAATRMDIRNEYPKAEEGGHRISRFPFMFNFIESESGVSPFMKSGHHVHTVADDQDAGFAPMVHGGIHPRDPTNCLC